MIGKVCDMLLRAAARRWPDGLAAEMLTEWRAELQAMPGRWSRIWFAFSLAVSRPHRAPALMPGGGLLTRLRVTTILAIALTPLAAAGFVYSVERLVSRASYSFNFRSDVIWTVVLAVLLALGTVVMTWWGVRRGRSTTMRGPAAVATLAGSVAVAALLVPGLVSGRDAVRIDMPAVLVWIPLLALTLAIVTWLSRAGKLAWAWVAGPIIALLFADLAIVAQVYSILPASSVSWPEAAAGLFQQLTSWHFSIELPADTRYPAVGDAKVFYSFGGALGPVMLLCSAFALSFATEAARARRLTPSEQV